jgi:hypothetical protein
VGEEAGEPVLHLEGYAACMLSAPLRQVERG